MNRQDFASQQSASRAWIGSHLIVGGTYKLKADAHGAKYGWAKRITIIEFQEKYFEGIKPIVEIRDIGAEKTDYFPRVVGIDEQGEIHTIALSRANWHENGEEKTITLGQMEYYEPV